MDKRWLDLRWPITVLVLGAMGFVLLARSSKHPIQLRLQVSFSNPLAVGGSMTHDLMMKEPVQVETLRDLHVRVKQVAPIQLQMTHPQPVKVEVGQQNAMEVKIEEDKPMEVQVKPEGSVKVRLGL